MSESHGKISELISFIVFKDLIFVEVEEKPIVNDRILVRYFHFLRKWIVRDDCCIEI